MEKKLVWAKMKGCPLWPGMICTFNPALTKARKPKNPSEWVFFFGSKNYAWIAKTDLKTYVGSSEKNIKRSDLKRAVKQANDYLRDPKKYKANGPEDKDEDTDESSEPEAPKPVPVVAPKPLPATKAAKKSYPTNKSESNSKTKHVNSSDTSSKRARPFPKDELNIDSTSEFEQNVARRRQNPVELPQVEEPNSKTKRKNSSSDNNASLKRARPSPKDEFNIDSTSEQNVSRSRRNLVELPQILGQGSQTTPISTNTSESRKNIAASTKIIGFLDVGIMGYAIVKNLLNSGHRVIIWNRDPSKSRKFQEMGAEVALTPSDVADQADIIFSCVSNPFASTELVAGTCGIFSTNQHFEGKGYVELSGLDTDTSQTIGDIILSNGGRYLEAPVLGSLTQAEEGTLILLAAGDRSLFVECQSCFRAMGQTAYFTGDTGNASKLNTVLQTFNGVIKGALAESLTLAEEAGLERRDVLQLMKQTQQAAIVEQTQQTLTPHDPRVLGFLQHALVMSDQLDLAMPITAAAKEVLKKAKPM